MKIKEIEDKTGLTRKAIRYYEECGLIKVEKDNEGFKNYTNQHFGELMNIKQLRLLDFSVTDINMYLKSEERESILEKKKMENEECILESKERIRLLNKLLQGESLEAIDFERELTKKKKEQRKRIKINWIYGIVNLIVLILICLYYIIVDVKFELNFIFFIQLPLLIISIRWDQNKIRDLKQAGKFVISRTWVEMLFKILVNCATYIMAVGLILRMYFNIGTIDWFNTAGNILMIVLFASGILLVLAFSFAYSTKNSMEYGK